MDSRRWKPLRAAGPLLPLFLVLCHGCAAPATYRFRVVDARTNLPIEGAGVRQSGLKRSLFTHYSKALRDEQRPPTDAEGMAIVTDIDDRKWIQTFTFSKEGYQPAKVKNTFTDDDVMQVLLFSPIEDVMTIRIVDREQVIVVPLIPAAAATQPSSRPADLP